MYPKVVQRVENAENVDPDRACPVDECPGDVVGVVAIPHEVLTSQEHRKGCLFDVAFENAGPFPGILAQETVHRVKGRPAPHLHGPEPDLVHCLGDGDHVLRRHPRCIDGLVAIPERVVLDLEGIL